MITNLVNHPLFLNFVPENEYLSNTIKILNFGDFKLDIHK